MTHETVSGQILEDIRFHARAIGLSFTADADAANALTAVAATAPATVSHLTPATRWYKHRHDRKRDGGYVRGDSGGP